MKDELVNIITMPLPKFSSDKKFRVTKEKELEWANKIAQERSLEVLHIDDAYGQSRYKVVDSDKKVVCGFSTLQDGDFDDCYPNFPLVVVRKRGKRNEITYSRRVKICPPHEYCKQLWLFMRAVSKPIDLPYFIELPNNLVGDAPDYITWYESLPSHIPSFEVERLEWRIFDNGKLEELLEKYPAKTMNKIKVEVDAEQLELGEENER